jgi:hypothetical protein
MSLTNRADDRSSAVIFLGRVLGVEIASPFQLGAVGKMIERVAHDCGIDEKGGLKDEERLLPLRERIFILVVLLL